MATIHEPLHIAEWLVTTLKGDTTLGPLINGVYDGLIPADKTLPAVRFQMQSPGNDVMVINGVRLWAAPLYLVAGVVEGSAVPLVPIADAIDNALHKAVGETTTISIQSCVREAPFTLTETDEGRIFRHAGGLYRITAIAK
jgi:hypothetical protein